MTDKLTTTSVDSNIGSISNKKDLEALFETIKVNEPARYAALEASGELDRQRELLKKK